MQSINHSFSFLRVVTANGLDKSHFQEQSKEQIKKTAPELDINPEKIAGLHVVNELEKALNIEGLSLKGLEEEDFTPEKVSDRIMASVQAAFGQFKQSQPDADEDEFFSEVKDGIEKGFEEAREILESFGALNGQIADNVDKTYDLTMEGLEQMMSKSDTLVETNSNPVPEPKQNSTVEPNSDVMIEPHSDTMVQSTMAFQGMATQTSQSADMQIETKDGDMVTFSFNQSSSSSQSSLQMEQAVSSLSAFQESFTEDRNFSISVDGDLDRGEKRALKKMMRRMNRVGNAFFSGNGRVAMKHAQKMGFNNKEIAGFSVEFSMQKSVQAVAAYQQVSLPQQNIDTDLLGQAGDFLNRAKEMLADAQTALQSFAAPEQSFNDLFSEIGSLSSRSSPEAEEPKDKQVFSGVVDNIKQDVFAEEKEAVIEE